MFSFLPFPPLKRDFRNQAFCIGHNSKLGHGRKRSPRRRTSSQTKWEEARSGSSLAYVFLATVHRNHRRAAAVESTAQSTEFVQRPGSLPEASVTAVSQGLQEGEQVNLGCRALTRAISNFLEEKELTFHFLISTYYWTYSLELVRGLRSEGKRPWEVRFTRTGSRDRRLGPRAT